MSAWSFVHAWLAGDTVWVPSATANTATILGEHPLQTPRDCQPDAQPAALAIEFGVPVVSHDNDFARFPQCGWVNPFA